MNQWIESPYDQDAIKKATDQALSELQCIRREAALRRRSDAEYMNGHLERARNILDHIQQILEKEGVNVAVD